MWRNDLIRMRHMRDAAQRALAFSVDKRREDFDTDYMLLFAVTRAIEVVGEAASKVSLETRRTFLRSRGQVLLECGIV